MKQFCLLFSILLSLCFGLASAPLANQAETTTELSPPKTLQKPVKKPNPNKKNNSKKYSDLKWLNFQCQRDQPMYDQWLKTVMLLEKNWEDAQIEHNLRSYERCIQIADFNHDGHLDLAYYFYIIDVNLYDETTVKVYSLTTGSPQKLFDFQMIIPDSFRDYYPYYGIDTDGNLIGVFLIDFQKNIIRCWSFPLLQEGGYGHFEELYQCPKPNVIKATKF